MLVLVLDFRNGILRVGVLVKVLVLDGFKRGLEWKG